MLLALAASRNLARCKIVQLDTVGEDDDGLYKAMDHEAGDFVERHWESIARVAQALLEHGTLQSDDIDALLL